MLTSLPPWVFCILSPLESLVSQNGTAEQFLLSSEPLIFCAAKSLSFYSNLWCVLSHLMGCTSNYGQLSAIDCMSFKMLIFPQGPRHRPCQIDRSDFDYFSFRGKHNILPPMRQYSTVWVQHSEARFTAMLGEEESTPSPLGLQTPPTTPAQTQESRVCGRNPLFLYPV